MYLEHYGLQEAPFRITPHTDFFFSGANRGATLEALLYAITHDEGIVKISGEVGSGKTMLCRVLMERLPENVAIIYLANPSLSREDILYALADELGIVVPEKSRAGIVMRALQEKLVTLYAEGKQVVVLIDEAHAMPIETLEEIRLLSNLESNRHKLLQLVLFGQPEINDTLARTDMRQLRERITHHFSLEPLVRDDIAQYLDFRMRAAGYRGPDTFTPTAVKLIAETSQGLTRRINILADKALLASFAFGTHQIGPREAKAAIRDAEFTNGKSAIDRHAIQGWGWALIGAATMLTLVVIWQRMTASPLPPQDGSQQTSQSPITARASEAYPTKGQPVATLPKQVSTAPRAEAVSSADYPLLAEALEKSRPWLESTGDHRWFLQLYVIDARHPEQVEGRLREMASTLGPDFQQIRLYRSQLSGSDRYGIIFGDFDTHKAALSVLEELPPSLKTNRPYPRQIAKLRPGNNTGGKWQPE